MGKASRAPTALVDAASSRRVLAAALALSLLFPVAGSAQDLLIVPFFGAKFAGHTNIVDPASPLEPAGATKPTFGVSAVLLGNGILGLEADFEHTAHFFERGIGGLISQSNVTTLTGNVVFSVPRQITQESLRPYLVGGVGLLYAHIQTQANIFNTSSNLLGLDVGGGVIGLVSPRAGVRFEARHFKNLSEDDKAVTFGSTRLSYWRLTAGLVLRY